MQRWAQGRRTASGRWWWRLCRRHEASMPRPPVHRRRWAAEPALPQRPSRSPTAVARPGTVRRRC